ncbi:MAG: hypothetical protein GC153_13445 [Alphaproteobacteria bacterium]|nr:hypothetical protein [Alphaproteobacteria bacterium]
MQFLDELKRRNVFRVAGVYLVVAWLTTQVVANVAPILGLPPVFGKGVLLLLVVGFPVALVLAWAFEVTPEGVKLTKNVDAEESISARTGRKLDYAILAGLAIVGVLIVSERFLAGDAGAGRGKRGESVAVLPFVDMSQHQNEGYFSDGISEEILNVLARIPNLKVAGRTSSFEFKGKNEDLRKIGEALGVNHVLEGSVRKDGDTVRITAQLVKTADGFHVWSKTYDRKLTDIFEVQDEIARAVANQLALSLGLSKDELVPDRTKDLVAYQKYLEAKQLFRKRGRANLERALLLLNEVTARDPNFAPAWTTLSAIYGVLEYYEPLDTPPETYNAWRAIGVAAADRAIALDPNDAEAYGYLGSALVRDLKWVPGFEALDKAKELAPDNTEVLDTLAQELQIAGYAKQSAALSARSIANDPLVGIYHDTLGNAYVLLGDVDRQIAEFEKAISLSPALTVGYLNLLHAYIEAGRFEDATTVAEKAAALGVLPGARSDAVKAIQAAWNDDEALRKLFGVYGARFDLDIAVKLGDGAALMSAIEQSWNAPHQLDTNIMYAPPLAMKNPRWKAEVKRIGLFDLWKKRGFPAICKPLGEDDFECGQPVGTGG